MVGFASPVLLYHCFMEICSGRTESVLGTALLVPKCPVSKVFGRKLEVGRVANLVCVDGDVTKIDGKVPHWSICTLKSVRNLELLHT